MTQEGSRGRKTFETGPLDDLDVPHTGYNRVIDFEDDADTEVQHMFKT